MPSRVYKTLIAKSKHTVLVFACSSTPREVYVAEYLRNFLYYIFYVFYVRGISVSSSANVAFEQKYDVTCIFSYNQRLLYLIYLLFEIKNLRDNGINVP